MKRRDPWFPIALLLIVMVAIWLGVAGPLWDAAFNASRSEWLGFLGNVLAGGCTLLAAYVAWRAVQQQIAPMQEQLSEMRAQTRQRLFEQLRTRATELQQESSYLDQIWSCANRGRITLSVLLTGMLSSHGHIEGLIRKASDDLRAKVYEVEGKMPAPWGSQMVQAARLRTMQNAMEAAQQLHSFATSVTAAVTKESIAAFQSAYAPTFDRLDKSLHEVQRAIDGELFLIGAKLSEMETTLL